MRRSGMLLCLDLVIDMTLLRITAAVLLLIWAALLLMGKRGFVHLLLLNAIGVIFAEFLITYRTRMKKVY